MTKPEELLERAWDLLEDGDLDGARKLGERLLEDASSRLDALLVLAACDREEGDTARALDNLREATEADPEWAMPVLWTAEILATEPGRVEEALTLAARAMDLADEEDLYLDALALKAGIEVGLGKTKAAIATLAEAPPVGEAAVPAPIARELGHLFLAVNDAASSRERFEALVAEDPSDADSWHGMGFAADALGDAKARDVAWLKTLALDIEADDEMGGDAVTDEELVAIASSTLTTLPRRVMRFLEGVPMRAVAYPSDDEVRGGLDPRAVVRLVASDGKGSVPAEVRLYRKALERECDDAEAMSDELADALTIESERVLGADGDA